MTCKDGDILSHFDKAYETEAEINNSSLHKKLFINHTVAVNKGKIKGKLSLEFVFEFVKFLRKINKILGYHLTFKTADLQNNVYTSLANDFKVTINNL